MTDVMFVSVVPGSYNGLYGEALLKRNTFLKLQVYINEQGFHKLRYMKG